MDKPTLHRFMSLFSGLERAHGIFNIKKSQGSKKVKGKANTVLAPVTESLWNAHLNGDQGLGIIPIRDDATVSWGAIDIDDYDMDFGAIAGQLQGYELPLVPIRTKSGGLHLYLFCSEPTEASLVRNTLMMWASMLGYAGSEVFPKQIQLANESDVGNWINMPYFSGNDTDRYAIWAGTGLNMDSFLDWAESLRVTPERLQELQAPLGETLSDGPPCLQVLVQQKFASGYRNQGLFNLGVYTKLRYGDEWEGRLEEFNRDLMDAPLPADEVVDIKKSLKKKDYFYKCKEPPISSFCNKDLCKTRPYGIGHDDEGRTVLLDGLTKVLTEPPKWIATVDGIRMELETDDLFNQSRFRRICVEKINKFPKAVKQPAWESLIQEALDNREEVEAPEDASNEGLFIQYLREFIAERPHALTRDELTLGKILHDEGRVYFRAKDLSEYLTNYHFRVSIRDCWIQLKRLDELDVKHHGFNTKAGFVRCWSLPEEDSQTEDYDTPRTDEGGDM